MKTKFNLLFAASALLALSLGFSSCSKDDDKNESIVGSWKYSASTADIKTNNIAYDALLSSAITVGFNASGKDIVLTFNADGTFEENDPVEGTVKGTYTYSNGVLTSTYEDEDEDEDEGSVSINVSVSGGTLTATIDMTKDFEDMFESEELEDMGIDLDGFKVTKAIIKQSYKKQ